MDKYWRSAVDKNVENIESRYVTILAEMDDGGVPATETVEKKISRSKNKFYRFSSFAESCENACTASEKLCGSMAG